jgi:acyl-CoA reductase-like NAD-dependent aldehyde dehydrogenase
MANNCEFALSSCAFSSNVARAKKVASQLVAGTSLPPAFRVNPNPSVV